MPEAPPKGTALPDVNVLMALTNPSHQHHRQAHQWLATVTRFATTPITECGLIRLLLNPAVTGQNVSGQQALTILRRLRSERRAVFLADSSSLVNAAIDLVGLAGHRQSTDVHLVNLAASVEGVLITFDRRITGSLAVRDQRHVVVL
ncbi:type II toxin-antitoxin system VapC family toxin [soil metagenome]